METHAEPTKDDGGKHFILNGEKLWCTNGTRAKLLVVMAKTPPKEIDGKKRNQVTAFVVDTDTPGVEVTHRCRFMGLKALFNAVIRFDNVKVPAENIIGAEGAGLRVALTTLNTGRITLPAMCIGLSKRAYQYARDFANEREQWGAPIGKHAAIADKIARMASTDLRDGVDDLPHFRARRSQTNGYPRGSSDGEAVRNRGCVEERRRSDADPWRPRLRDCPNPSGLEAKSPMPSSARCAMRASTASSKARRRSCACSSRVKRWTRICA